MNEWKHSLFVKNKNIIICNEWKHSLFEMNENIHYLQWIKTSLFLMNKNIIICLLHDIFTRPN